MGKRIILVGHACSGKDFLRKKFEEQGFIYATSYTTRPPRPGEVDGKDYNFISESKANYMKSMNEWYEIIEFNGWYYGTTRKQFHMDDIFIMTPGGISHITKEDRADSFIIFLDIPLEVRRERLKERVMEGDTLERRLEADEKDFKNFTDYDIKITDPNF